MWQLQANERLLFVKSLFITNCTETAMKVGMNLVWHRYDHLTLIQSSRQSQCICNLTLAGTWNKIEMEGYEKGTWKQQSEGW